MKFKTFLPKTLILLWIGFLSGPVQSQTTKKEITLEDIWAKNTFSPVMVQGFASLKDGKSYSSLASNSTGENFIVKYSYESGKVLDTVLKSSWLKMGNETIHIEDYHFSEDESKILISSGTERIYRHSTRAFNYVWDRVTKKLTKVSEKKGMYATFSPDGSKVAFVSDNDLYYSDLKSGVEVQITKDGKRNEIINGATDWVYEEEFSMSQAFHWSPDGKRIAWYRFDESKVKEFTFPIYGKLYPDEEKYKYPKAGESNSTIQIMVFELFGNTIKKMDTGDETDIYIPRIGWTKNPEILSIQRLNRLQNKLDLLLADANSGKSTVIYTESNKYYVDITDNLTFLSDKKHFVFSNEKNGYHHLYLYDLKGNLINAITSGNWDIDHFYGVDEKNKVVFYTSSEVSPMERHLYCVGLDGKNKKKLTQKPGFNTPVFNSSYTMFMNTHSGINTPPSFTIHQINGKLIREIEGNQKLAQRLKEYQITNADFFKFKTSENVELNGWMIKPSDFDPAKKYPVLMFVYGGPGSQTVTDKWAGGNYFWHQYLANKGYVVVSVDNRGTGYRGEEFKKMTYLQLGKHETEDQIETAKYLGQQSYVDASRIGIWGWSYGGYMSSLCLTKGNKYFKTAIAVAPVTNWRYYDNIYTERYMRTPQENGKNYDVNSPLSHVDSIRGKYLIIHGTADDNVHFQNAVEMVDAMIKKNIPFDSEFYPNKNHGIYGGKSRLHLFNRMTKFVLENL